MRGEAPHAGITLTCCCVGLGGSFGGFDGDAESECFDLVGQAAGVGFGAATHEPVRPEVLVGDVTVEHVVGGDEDRVFDGLACLGMTASSAEPLELGAQVGALGAPGGFGALGQGGGKPLGARARPAAGRPTHSFHPLCAAPPGAGVTNRKIPKVSWAADCTRPNCRAG